MTSSPPVQEPLLLNQLAKLEGIVDGVRVQYTSDTVFLVQISKGKGSFRTRFSTVGNLASAVRLYKGINIGQGFNKRLVKITSPKNQLIARSYS